MELLSIRDAPPVTPEFANYPPGYGGTRAHVRVSNSERGFKQTSQTRVSDYDLAVERARRDRQEIYDQRRYELPPIGPHDEF